MIAFTISQYDWALLPTDWRKRLVPWRVSASGDDTKALRFEVPRHEFVTWAPVNMRSHDEQSKTS